jgi:hypothetical protein
MKDLAFLEYTFVFEPSINTWNRGTDFENDLADFFSSNGLEASIVKTIGGTTRRIILVKAADKLNKMRMAEDQPQKGPVKALNDAMKKASGVSIDKKGSK